MTLLYDLGKVGSMSARWIYTITLMLWLCLNVQARAASAIEHESIHSSNSNKKIEIYWSKPEGTGPWPVLVLIHPHQEWPHKVGAEIFVKNTSLTDWASKGFVTVAVSQPGYGLSDGPADFCGPKSQQAVIEVISYFRNMPISKKDQIFLYGGSRGAVIASIVAAKDPLLAGVVLKSGLYDLVDAYTRYPWYSSIKLSMIWEVGWNPQAQLKERSALFFADQIKTPLLIIHGTQDDRAGIEYAKSLADKVNGSGGNAELITLESEHIIPMEQIKTSMESFFKKILHR